MWRRDGAPAAIVQALRRRGQRFAQGLLVTGSSAGNLALTGAMPDPSYLTAALTCVSLATIPYQIFLDVRAYVALKGSVSDFAKGYPHFFGTAAGAGIGGIAALMSLAHTAQGNEISALLAAGAGAIGNALWTGVVSREWRSTWRSVSAEKLYAYQGIFERVGRDVQFGVLCQAEAALGHKFWTMPKLTSHHGVKQMLFGGNGKGLLNGPEFHGAQPSERAQALRSTLRLLRKFGHMSLLGKLLHEMEIIRDKDPLLAGVAKDILHELDDFARHAGVFIRRDFLSSKGFCGARFIAMSDHGGTVKEAVKILYRRANDVYWHHASDKTQPLPLTPVRRAELRG